MAAGTQVKFQELKPEVRQMLAHYREHNPIKLKQSGARNIIFVGRARSGKSTAIEVLKEPCHRTRQTGTIFAETRDAAISFFSVEVPPELAHPDDVKIDGVNVNYSINIIDTPGLFEITKEGSDARDVEQLERLIVACMKQEITMIHAIFFVIARNGAYQPQDVEALDRFLSLFSGARDKVHILITKCEEAPETTVADYQRQLTSVPAFSRLMAGHTPSFLPAGAITDASVWPDLLLASGSRVLEMRSAIFQKIFECREPFSLAGLTFSDSLLQKTLNLWRKIKDAPTTSTPTADFVREVNTLDNRIPILPPHTQEEVRQFVDQHRRTFKEVVASTESNKES